MNTVETKLSREVEEKVKRMFLRRAFHGLTSIDQADGSPENGPWVYLVTDDRTQVGQGPTLRDAIDQAVGRAEDVLGESFHRFLLANCEATLDFIVRNELYVSQLG